MENEEVVQEPVLEPVAKEINYSPFSPTLTESEALEVSDEQKKLIKAVLDISSSDVQFAQRAFDGIMRILTTGVVESETESPASTEGATQSYE